MSTFNLEENIEKNLNNINNNTQSSEDNMICQDIAKNEIKKEDQSKLNKDFSSYTNLELIRTSNKKFNFDSLLKILLIGDSSVGKSCIFLRITEDSFTDNFISTVGVDFRTLSIKNEKENIGLQIWDTAGTERYLSITKNYFKNSQGIVVCYDVSSRKSFYNTSFWLKTIKENTYDITLLLVGNKSDLNEQREVSFEEGLKLSEEHSMLFIEVSAKTGENIDKAFLLLADYILRKKSSEDRRKEVGCNCKCHEERGFILKNIREMNSKLNNIGSKANKCCTSSSQ